MSRILRLLPLLLPLWLSGPADAAKQPPPKPFVRAEELLGWITAYRTKPEPERLGEAVKAMVQGRLIKDLDESGVYIGFVAGVIGSNPDRADRLIASLFPLDPQDQVLLIRAIAYSDLPDWKGTLSRFAERMPARAVLIRKYVFENKATLDQLDFKEMPSAIDINWGYYYATGAESPLRRIITVLPWSNDKNDLEKLTVGAMAKWTLAQNAARDTDLLLTLKSLAPEAAKPAQAPLAEAIEAAETLELAKVRKAAMATIDELKAKGPESTRNYNWWGQAGQTALALGCVAASALGQVEFGIPCVIGGALSTAALKYLGPDANK